MRWDLFCRVIDNLGDLGVCWRLAAELAARGEAVRLWVDAPGPLDWMVPGGRAGAQRLGVELCDWDPTSTAPAPPAEVVVEAFGCDPHPGYLQSLAHARPRAWFNLEYLSAEAWVARCHGLPSPIMAGPAAGLHKRFFYPGFTPDTGGLIHEHSVNARQAGFDRDAWLASLGLAPRVPGERLVSLFCYEPPALPALLRQLAGEGLRLLVTTGRAQAAMEAAIQTLGSAPRPAWTALPALPQPDFDHLLWACDLNFVRGEDSLVRALWAGRPFVWQIYRQGDGVHHTKLAAFLDWLQAPPSLRQAHAAWNADRPSSGGAGTDQTGPAWPALDLPAWGQTAAVARQRLRAGPELVSGLIAAARAGGETSTAAAMARGGPIAAAPRGGTPAETG